MMNDFGWEMKKFWLAGTIWLRKGCPKPFLVYLVARVDFLRRELMWSWIYFLYRKEFDLVPSRFLRVNGFTLNFGCSGFLVYLAGSPAVVLGRVYFSKK